MGHNQMAILSLQTQVSAICKKKKKKTALLFISVANWQINKLDQVNSNSHVNSSSHVLLAIATAKAYAKCISFVTLTSDQFSDQ